MPSNGQITIKRYITQENIEEEHKINLQYDNGQKSPDTTLKVIYDKTAPIFTTPTLLEKKENVKLITNINANDTNKQEGLSYTLINEKDAQLFTLTEEGELSFRDFPNFEEPLSENKDNNYEIVIKVIDKSGNPSLLHLTVKIIDILDSKPSIEAFNIEISKNITVGSTLGEISIDQGDSSITNLYLTGNGKEYFRLYRTNDNSVSISLMRYIGNPQIFNLNIVATNEFGTTSQTVTIDVLNMEKIAQAHMKGVLSGATVKLIKINYNNTKELINTYTTTTNAHGSFDLKPSLLNSNSFYIYEVSGGVDVTNSKENKGVLRLIAKGSWIQNASHQIKVTPLSEFLYDYVAHYIENDYFKLEDKLQETAKILLSEDLNGNYIINAEDVIIFNSNNNYNVLYDTLKYNNSYQVITNKIQDNNSDYIKGLFNAKVIKNFENIEKPQPSYNTNVQFQGSIAYYFKEDTFYTYDINNRKILGTLKLEAQNLAGLDPLVSLFLPENAFNIQVYLDLKNHRAYIVNLNQKVFIIDINDLKKPEFLNTFNSGRGSFIALSINNRLYMYNYSMFISSFNIYDCDNPYNINKHDSRAMKEFNSITNNKVYSFSTQECYQTKQLIVNAYSLQNIYNNIDKKDTYYIPSHDCRENAYFDENYMYIYHYNLNSFKIYELIEESSEIELVNSLPISITKIFNQDSQHMYVYSDGHIKFIDITDINDLDIKDTIAYKYKYNSLLYFATENNLQIKIQDNFIIESSRIIDLKSHKLSSIYTETENGIDLTLFEPYMD